MSRSRGESDGDPTPTSVARVLAFVNTRADGSGRTEHLPDAAAAAGWLESHDLLPAGAVLTDADLAAVLELRHALVVVLLAHSDTGDSSPDKLGQAHAELIRAAHLYPVIPEITADGVTFAPGRDGVAGALAAILAAVAHAAQDGQWSRIKACQNPPCHFGFYDRTRNGSTRYCSSTCGTQVSMRAYRRRRRPERPERSDTRRAPTG